MGYARIRIGGDLMVELLHLPAMSRVVQSQPSERYEEVIVVVEHPDLPEPKEGVIAEASPTFRKNVPVQLVDWNVQK